MSRHRRDPEPDFVEFDAPPEARQEQRVAHAHTRGEWRNKLREYQWRCAYCGIHSSQTQEGYLTRDHLHPVIAGGTDVIENIVPACLPCNKAKGVTMPGTNVPLPKRRIRRVPWERLTPLQRLYHGPYR